MIGPKCDFYHTQNKTKNPQVHPNSHSNQMRRIDSSGSMNSLSTYRLHNALKEKARVNRFKTYDITQLYICPLGDWSKNLIKTIEEQKQLWCACWVRGLFASPFSIAQNFSHLVLGEEWVFLQLYV